MIRERVELKRRLPHVARKQEDSSLIVAVDGNMVLSNEDATPVRTGDEITAMRIIAGG